LARQRTGPRGSFGGKNFLKVDATAFTDLLAEIKAFEDDIPEIMRLTETQVAEQLISKAKKRAGQLGHVAPKAAESLRVVDSSKQSIRIMYGGNEWPYAMGAEFGSNHFHQFRSYRMAGYFVGQAVYETQNYGLEETFYQAFSTAVDEYFS
jgi:hypothetical protein